VWGATLRFRDLYAKWIYRESGSRRLPPITWHRQPADPVGTSGTRRRAPFASPANRLAWREATRSTIVAASDDCTHITDQHTTPC